MAHASKVLLAASSVETVLPAAKALLATMAKLLATAHAPGAVLRAGLLVSRARSFRQLAAARLMRVRRQALCALHGRPLVTGCVQARQEALIVWVPEVLCPSADQRAAGRALPAELLPHAAAQLLPLLLLPPECVRGLGAALLNRHTSTLQVTVFLTEALVSSPLSGLHLTPTLPFQVTVFLTEALVSPQLFILSFLSGLHGAAVPCAVVWTDRALSAGAGRPGRAGRLRPARIARRAARVQGARAGVRGPGALCRGGAAQAGRVLCAHPASRGAACQCQGAALLFIR